MFKTLENESNDARFTKEIRDLAEIIYPVLLELAYGSEKAITYDALMPIFVEVSYHKYGYGVVANKRKLRKTCKALLRVFAKPVISCSKGVFIARTQEEIDAFAATERSAGKERFANADVAEMCSPEKKKVEGGYFPFVQPSI